MKIILSLVIALAACAFGTPIDDADIIAPFFDAARDTRLLLFTRSNRVNPVQVFMNDIGSIENSPFDRTKPLRVMTHGWYGDDTTDLITGASRVLLDHYDFNVLVIDWGEGAQTINYIAAVQRVRPVGVFVASYLDFLQANGLIDYNRVSLIGFSLGAHVCGFVGKSVQRGRIDTIIGLDPAGPLFSVSDPSGRLDAGDANYVEAVHTNGPTFLIVGAGIGAVIAHADFFANGGRSQPGCILNSCSHSRAVEYYVESFTRNGFFSLRCNNESDATNGRCTGEPGAWPSSEPSNAQKALRGIFHFETARSAPFALGSTRP